MARYWDGQLVETYKARTRAFARCNCINITRSASLFLGTCRCLTGPKVRLTELVVCVRGSVCVQGSGGPSWVYVIESGEVDVFVNRCRGACVHFPPHTSMTPSPSPDVKASPQRIDPTPRRFGSEDGGEPSLLATLGPGNAFSQDIAKASGYVVPSSTHPHTKSATSISRTRTPTHQGARLDDRVPREGAVGDVARAEVQYSPPHTASRTCQPPRPTSHCASARALTTPLQQRHVHNLNDMSTTSHTHATPTPANPPITQGRPPVARPRAAQEPFRAFAPFGDP